MTTLQLLPTPTAASPPNARIAAFERLESIDARTAGWDRRLSALTMVLVDTLLAGDTATLQAVGDPLRDRLAQLYGDEVEQGHGRELRGWLMAMLSMTRLALERLPAPEDLQYPPGTQPFEFLMLLNEEPVITSGQIMEALGTGDSQVSRTGRDLIAAGLVLQRRSGRQALWELTPRGRQVVRRLKPTPSPKRSEKRASARGSRAAKAAVPPRSRTGPNQRVATRAFKSGSTSTIRHVIRNEGGWAIAKTPDGRPIVRLDNKQKAVARAKQILANAGGGKLVEHTISGGSREFDVPPSKR